MAFMLRNMTDKKVMEFSEILLAILYLYLVVGNLLWFITPLYEREEYTRLVVWFEDTADLYRETFWRGMDRAMPWRRRGGRKRDANGEAGKNKTFLQSRGRQYCRRFGWARAGS